MRPLSACCAGEHAAIAHVACRDPTVMLPKDQTQDRNWDGGFVSSSNRPRRPRPTDDDVRRLPSSLGKRNSGMLPQLFGLDRPGDAVTRVPPTSSRSIPARTAPTSTHAEET